MNNQRAKNFSEPLYKHTTLCKVIKLY